MKKKVNLFRKSLLPILIFAIVLFNTSCSTYDSTKEIDTNSSNIGLEYVDSIVSYSLDYGYCILVKYTYTNNHTTDSCFEWTFDINAYQNGIRLEHAYFDGLDTYGDFKDYTNNNLDTIIAPGTTITICEAFKLNNNTSNITIKVSEDFDAKAILTNLVEPLALITPVKVNITYKRKYIYNEEYHWFYIVKYSFTNTSDIPKSFDDTFDVVANTDKESYNTPITLERSSNITKELSNSIDISSYKLENSKRTINSGSNIDVYLLFELKSDLLSDYKDLHVSLFEKNTDNLVFYDYTEDSDFY